MPQCLPIKVARTCKADAVSVKLCFLVKMRKARGRRVAAGRSTGRMLAFTPAVGAIKGRIGCTGVPKAGEEEGIGIKGTGRGGGLKIDAARGFSI